MIGESTTAPSFEVETGSDHAVSAVAWGAIIAGGVAAAAVSLIMLALGAGLGFSVLAPWSTAASSASFHIATGLYLIVTAMIASSIGGYLAGRLRRRWIGAHTREVFFRDTAHGFLAWGFATLLSAVALTSAASALVSGAASSVTHVVGQSPGLLDGYVDSLVRGASASNPISPDTSAARAEIGRIFAASFANGGEFTPADSSYIASIVAARSGVSQAQAEERVAAVIGQAKETATNARKAAAKLSLWLTVSLLVGAFAASLAAIEGGGLRDDTWHYRV